MIVWLNDFEIALFMQIKSSLFYEFQNKQVDDLFITSTDCRCNIIICPININC